MTLQERKNNLLKHSATEVRNSRTLFAEFVFIYTAEGGNERDCMSCKFSSVYTNWQRSNTKIVTNKEVMADNTFKLKNPKELISVPGGLGVINSNSPDELVVTFLNQKDGNKQARIERFFAEVPASMRKKKAAKETAKDAPVKKSAKKK